jgi:hypothetical protein
MRMYKITPRGQTSNEKLAFWKSSYSNREFVTVIMQFAVNLLSVLILVFFEIPKSAIEKISLSPIYD